MRVLVTGGAGYVGSHFVAHLLDKNAAEKIVIVDDLSLGHAELLPHSSVVQFEKISIADVQSIAKLLRDNEIDVVVHFAGFISVGESELQPLKYFRNNLADSIGLLEAMQQTGVRKLVFSSSAACYGPPKQMPIPEDHPCAPVSAYGDTKLMFEEILHTCQRTIGLQYLCLRYFNAAGAHESGKLGEWHDPETHLIPLALRATENNAPPLKVFGNDYDTPDGTCIRDYIHVSDLADAHHKALESLDQLHGAHAINLGSGKGYSVMEIIDTCEKITGKKVRLEYAPRRAGDPAVLLADVSKAERLLGWKPVRSLEDMIATAWRWHNKTVSVS